jgi:hypothetical protein
MYIGEVLTYQGRRYVLVGLEPMSVPDRRVELRDAETGDLIAVPYVVLAESREGLIKDG